MRRIFQIVAIVSVLLNGLLIYFFFFRGNTAKVDDNRTAIVMTPENKQFVLQEMRLFVEGVQQIQEGIVTNNPQLIIKSGESHGKEPLLTAPNGLIRSLSKEFKTMAFGTHDIFKEIADSARVDYNPMRTQQQLNKLLNSCVACHRVYRIRTQEEIIAKQH